VGSEMFISDIYKICKKSAVVILLLIILTSCSRELVNRKLYLAMGNIPVEVKVYFKQTVDFDKIFSSVQDTIQFLDSVFSKYNPKSPVYQFNNNGAHIALNEYQKELLFLSAEMNERTGGLFDIRVETILEYYRRCEKEQKDLSLDTVIALASLLSKDSLMIRNDTLYKNDPALMIDFGGIAKGYFGDVIKRILIRNGVKKAVINLGGDVVLFNLLEDKQFKVGIRKSDDDGIYKYVSVKSGAIVTSGDYFRFYSINGKRYCHIISPITGLSADESKSVTVTAENGYTADAAATALMLMNEKEIEEFKLKNANMNIYIQ